MKQVLLFLIAVVFAGSLAAQNNSIIFFSYKTDTIINGTTHTIYGDGATKDVKEEFGAVMSGQDSMLVAVKRQEISTIPGTNDYFCWYLCYLAVPSGTLPVWYADDSLWMYKNDTINNFASYLQPEMNLGQATYRYVFYPADNPTDSVSFDIMFDIVTVGVDELNETDIQTYPNPTSDILNVSIPSSIDASNLNYEIFDLNGKQKSIGSLKPGNNAIELSEDFSKGTYLIRLLNENEIILNRKFLVE